MSAGPGAPLAVDTTDTQACKALIAGLPLTNAPESQQILAALLHGLMHRPPGIADYLDILEAARMPVSFLQDEIAHRYANKPLPPLPAEQEAFLQVLSLWQAMARAYARAAELGAGEADDRDRLALICQRCVHYAGKVVLEYFRARREPLPGAWIDLHGYYATAEEWGIDKTAISEPLDEADMRQSAAEAYAAILLVDLASPYSRSAHELAWITRLARYFAPLTAIRSLGLPIETRVFGIDLMHDASTRPLEQLPQADSVRHFDTRRLAPKIQEILARLKAGEHPDLLGLGDDCPAVTAYRLLLLLYKPWCLAATPRRHRRHNASGTALACFGFEAIHFHVSGAEFTQPAHVRMYSRGDMERISTFRDRVDARQPDGHAPQEQIGYPLEHWMVADQSVSGFRLLRATAGARIERGQLFCLKPPDGEYFLLAQVSWHMMLKDELLVGIHVLPGVPQGIALRQTGANASPSAAYMRAFLLPEITALKEQASLVMPRGWYHPERVVEAFAGKQIHLRLSELQAQGADFERATFVRL